jgi:hypothetical protein
MESITCEYCEDDIPDEEFENHVLLCRMYYDNLEMSTRLFSNRQISSGQSLNSFIMEHFHVQRTSPNNQNNLRSVRETYTSTRSSLITTSPSQYSPHFEPVYVGVKNIDSHLMKADVPLIDINCAICLDCLAFKDDPCKLKCNHLFCTFCIKSWLKINKKCPLCKFELEN